MLHGEKVGLRARHDSDITILHEELYDDVPVRLRADSRPWRPIPPGSVNSPYQVKEPGDDVTFFSVVELSRHYQEADERHRGELAGEALLWGIDTHNRVAHIGLSLRPAFRGRGLGTDVVAVLCQYGFAIRGLHRLQVETLPDNAAMLHAAAKVGFTVEGTLRRSAWVSGEFVDEVVLGLLDSEWAAR